MLIQKWSWPEFIVEYTDQDLILYKYTDQDLKNHTLARIYIYQDL